MRFLYPALAIVGLYSTLLFADGMASVQLPGHLDAKFDCVWGDAGTGGSARIFQDTLYHRAQVFLERHYWQGDYIDTDTAWFEGPLSSVPAGTYILGAGGARLLFDKDGAGFIEYQKLSISEKKIKCAVVKNPALR